MLSQLVQPNNLQKQAKYSKKECLSTEFSAGFNIFMVFCDIWKVSQDVLTPGNLNCAREKVWHPKPGLFDSCDHSVPRSCTVNLAIPGYVGKAGPEHSSVGLSVVHM